MSRKFLEEIPRKEKCKFGHPLVYVPKQRRLRCRECDRLRHKEYYANNKHKVKSKARGRQLRYLYDITQDEYNRILLEQKSQCAICGNVSSLVVDHNHATGKVRGLLCKKCNFVLGLVDDKKEILIRGAEYLSSKV